MAKKEISVNSTQNSVSSRMVHYCQNHSAAVARIFGLLLGLEGALIFAYLMRWPACEYLELLMAAVIVFAAGSLSTSCGCGRDDRDVYAKIILVAKRHSRRLGILYAAPFIVAGLSFFIPNTNSYVYPLIVFMVVFLSIGLCAFLPTQLIGFTMSLIFGKWRPRLEDYENSSADELHTDISNALSIKDTETADILSKYLLNRTEEMDSQGSVVLSTQLDDHAR